MDKKICILDMVKVILMADPKTRNSDNLLYIRFLDELGKVRKQNYIRMSMIEFFGNMAALDVPSIETVGRCRRKLQEKHPELKSNDMVTRFRAAKEQEFRDFARL